MVNEVSAAELDSLLSEIDCRVTERGESPEVAAEAVTGGNPDLDARLVRAYTVGDYGVVVWFATAATPRVVASMGSQTSAFSEAYRYLGADARGVWVEYPNGYREAVL